MKYSIKNALIALVSLLFVFQSCTKKDNSINQPTSKKTPLVKVQPAMKAKMATFVDITGTIQASLQSELKSTSDGLIDRLYARENQNVEKGKVLAIVHSNESVTLIANNQLRIQQLEKKIQTTDKNSNDYLALKQELEKAKEDLEYARKMYQPIPIVCPMNGMVTHRWLDEGSQVGAKERILTISNMQSLVIKAEVNEKFFPYIAAGKKLSVVLDAFPGDTLVGMISLVYPEISSDTRTVKFDVKLIKPVKKLLPGMMALLRIPTEKHENAIAVPSDAVLTNPANEKFVFVINKDSMAFKRIVKTGITNKKQIEILSGVKAKEMVVVMGQEMLKDSIKVKIAGAPKNMQK